MSLGKDAQGTLPPNFANFEARNVSFHLSISISFIFYENYFNNVSSTISKRIVSFEKDAPERSPSNFANFEADNVRFQLPVILVDLIYVSQYENSFNNVSSTISKRNMSFGKDALDTSPPNFANIEASNVSFHLSISISFIFYEKYFNNVSSTISKRIMSLGKDAQGTLPPNFANFEADNVRFHLSYFFTIFIPYNFNKNVKFCHQ